MDSKFDTVVLDIETDSLNATKIHCICIQDYATGEQKDFIQEQGCEEFKQFHNDERKYIMHNGISFDGPEEESLYRRINDSTYKAATAALLKVEVSAD